MVIDGIDSFDLLVDQVSAEILKMNAAFGIVFQSLDIPPGPLQGTASILVEEAGEPPEEKRQPASIDRVRTFLTEIIDGEGPSRLFATV
jgi:hypothetical protein